MKILVKKRTAQLEKDTREAGRKIQDELNDQVRKWGIDVQKVELSTVKIMKPPESGSTTAVGSILRGLGVKRDEKYLTQQDVVRASHGSFDQKGSLMHQGSFDSKPFSTSITKQPSLDSEASLDCTKSSETESGKKEK